MEYLFLQSLYFYVFLAHVCSGFHYLLDGQYICRNSSSRATLFFEATENYFYLKKQV